MLNRQSIRIVPFAALIAATLLVSGCGVNPIPTYEQHAKAKWSEFRTNISAGPISFRTLSSPVKGFADQEKSVLTGVTEARAKATQAQINLPPDILTNPDAMKKYAEAQNQLTARLGSCLPSPSAIPTSNPGRTSSRCKSRSKEPKTASPSHAAIISMRYKSLTPS